MTLYFARTPEPGHCPPPPDFPARSADLIRLEDAWWEDREMRGSAPTVREVKGWFRISTDAAAKLLREARQTLTAIAEWEYDYYDTDGFYPTSRAELDAWMGQPGMTCHCIEKRTAAGRAGFIRRYSLLCRKVQP